MEPPAVPRPSPAAEKPHLRRAPVRLPPSRRGPGSRSPQRWPSRAFPIGTRPPARARRSTVPVSRPTPGPGRCRAPTPIACTVRVRAARVASRGPACGPAVRRQPHQPRRHLPGWRPVGPRPEHRLVGQGRCGQLEQGLRRRPTRLTRSLVRTDQPGRWDPCQPQRLRSSPCSQRSTGSTVTGSRRGCPTISLAPLHRSRSMSSLVVALTSRSE